MKALLTALCLLTLGSVHAIAQDSHRQREREQGGRDHSRHEQREQRPEHTQRHRPEQRRDDQQRHFRHEQHNNHWQAERRSEPIRDQIQRDERLQNHITGKSFSRDHTALHHKEAPRHYSSHNHHVHDHHYQNPPPRKHYGSITRYSDHNRHHHYPVERRHYRPHIYNHHHHHSYHRHVSHGVHYDAAYLLGGIIIGALIADVGTADGYYYNNGRESYSYSVLRQSGCYESFYRNGERILIEVHERYCRAY